MKMKRFLAPDIRQALQQVKETLGPDAVILSNRKTDEGVEIVAARDFEMETMPPSSPPRAEPEKPKVTPKPSFSARGYSAVAELADASDKPKPVSGRTKKPAKDTRQVADINKVTLNNGGNRSPSKDPLLTRQKPVAQSAASTGDSPVSATLSNIPVHSEEMQGMRQELQQMRFLLDRHLSRQAWREEVEKYPTRLDILRQLTQLSFSPTLSREFAQRCGQAGDIAFAWEQVRQVISQAIPIAENPLLDYGGIVALVGPTGVGKTTTVAKLAARFRLKHGPRQIALVTTDNYRIAAHEQLSTYARILGVPVRVAGNAEELHGILRGFMDKKLVLIDTAGMSQKDLRLADQFALFRESEIEIETHLVLSASSQLKSLKETIAAFSGFGAKSCILTKLDEAGTLGPALSALLEHRLPAAFVTDGQQVPENLHRANARDLVERCFAGEEAASAPDKNDFAFEDWVAYASV